ncbi:MAG: hypothetical protein CVV64_14300 [Candidatus Wallbacteria bacterium HGW-Wallbacteria-1]|jgi:hypothetical protein|uniref:Prepilin-type N-terminal cleavage/methylation domain-containing protein n=1 Tax=Candidatus Wallbacteria bacterium HGW-Wallbacteria-1 TaxID=2013854 RepID=A0A2N1PM72_9BACT|nr:MAG: hypothetical protein CVV64_14300 [Candidatus Wallbacteria bacterium HGW-Wallbacteria-1]
MRSSSSGMSLVEILIAVVLIGGALVPLYGLFQSGSSGAARVADREVAMNLAAESLEVLSNVPFRELRDNFQSYGAYEEIQAFGRVFRVTPSICMVWETPEQGQLLMKLIAKVTWKEKGQQRSLSLGTLVANEEVR